MTAAAGKLPARALPILYLGTAHVSLALACLFAALWPQAVAGFFYHAWLVGLVHLVTLGWISFSILGAMYIVGPLALRMEIPARRMDYVAYACAVIGLIGMVGHFWIQQYAGMAWSAATIASGIVYMTVRIVARVRTASLQPSIALHIVLACVNFWIAASMGLLLAFDKFEHFLPGYALTNVFAHAHLAALGWATMMVLGVAYRMLPMMFPSKMADGRLMYASAVLMETGVLGLFVALLVQSPAAAAFGIVIVAALVVFITRVAWMRRHMVSRPIGAPRVDFGQLHAASAAISLTAATAIGMVLLFGPPSSALLRAAAAYGVLGLVGFLAQMVVAMEAKLLPMVAWFWAYAGGDYQVAPPSPHVMRRRSLQAAVFGAWTVGVPCLAAGMFFESAHLVAVGAWALFAGVSIGTLDSAFVVAHGFRSAAATPRHAA
ncbi:MAG TPA: hypothetical protein VH583_25230 [Vicinamibacterales bacterium]|jgi:hypothetical protein